MNLLLQKPTQRITLFNGEREVLDVCMLHLKAKKLTGVKISLTKYTDNEWHCTIGCESAEVTYYREILPILYNLAETQSCRILLELDDKSEPVRRCPREVVASFGLKSPYAFGGKDDHEFMQKLRKDITQGTYAKTAAVSYYIIGGASATIGIPCLELSKMEKYLEDEFKSYGVKRFTINVVEREAA